MRKSQIITIILLGFIVVLAILIAIHFIQRGNNSSQAAAPATGGPGGGRGQGRAAITVRVTPVQAGTIERGVVINGDVLARNQVSIFPTVGGRLVETRFGVGDRVNRGDIVARVDPSRPGEIFSHSPVVSTISGTVLQAPFNPGDTVSTMSAVYVVGDLSALLLETFVPERFVSAIRAGLRAQVQFEAIPGETFVAEVAEISPVLDPASRTLRIHLRFVNPATGQTATDPRIRAGMFATVSLVTSSRVNVPVIPRISAIRTYNRWFVFTVNENNIAVRNEVELGAYNEDYFEVLSGVSLGDRVVSAGQNFLSAGDTVRIVD